MTTLSAVVAAIHGWRQRREDYLLQLVVTFNAAIEDQRYEEAERIACEAVDEFPENEIAISMREKSRLALELANGTYEPEGYGCFDMWGVSTLNHGASATAADNRRDP